MAGHDECHHRDPREGTRFSVCACQTRSSLFLNYRSSCARPPLARQHPQLACSCVAAAAAYRAAVAGSPPDSADGPVFSLSGPNADLYGAAEGFLIVDPLLAPQSGALVERKYRVGARLPVVWLWLFDLAASRVEAPICALQ
jgi:hypothetical protein